MIISESKAIKKKLMAATSMLLVACIMLISATYAWFTLSTAPEITGISTTIGANGSLEIALADSSTWSDPDTLVETSTGVGNIHEANITWGNLIDLNDAMSEAGAVASSYGLHKITLLPSRLNAVSDGTNYNVNGQPLWTPNYGTDGRIAELASNTGYANYLLSGDSFEMVTDADPGYGVRAIGTASGMTDRQLAYRSARVNLSNAISGAKSAAKASLVDNGNALAAIIVEKAMGEPTYGEAEVITLKDVIADLTTAQAKMQTAWEAAVVSYAASAAGEGIDGLKDEAGYLAFKAKIEAKDYTVADSTVTANGVNLPLPGEFAAYYAGLTNMAKDVSEASTGVNALTGNAITWAQISTPLSKLVNPDVVTINGYTADQVKANVGAIVNAVASGQGVQVQMPTGSGVYADIADYCGDYSAAITVDLTYGEGDNKIEAKDVPATMTTVSTVSPAKFSAAQSVVNNAGAPQGAGAADSKLTDFYGYTLDYYLRTNAADSNLLLQVDPAQRIYSDSTNEETQGGGSCMTFTSADAEFTSEQMKELMKAIRVVFTDGSGSIIKVAVLDTVNAEVGGSTVTADLKLVNYTFDTSKGGNMLKITETNGAPSFLEKQVLIENMEQNTAVKLSAMVYLDGDYVTNASVANAASSMTGRMNLQFSSSAKLVPMDNTELKGVTTGNN